MVKALERLRQEHIMAFSGFILNIGQTASNSPGIGSLMVVGSLRPSSWNRNVMLSRIEFCGL